MSFRERVATYYREKQIERIIRIDMGIHRGPNEESGGFISRDTFVRIFLTFFSVVITARITDAILRPLHLPKPILFVAGGLAILVGVEIADSYWLRNVRGIDRFFNRTLPIAIVVILLVGLVASYVMKKGGM